MGGKPTISIRRAVQADAAAVLECLRAAFEPYREQYTPPAFADTVLSEDAYARRLAEMALFVAVDPGGEIVGTIGYSLPPRDRLIRGSPAFLGGSKCVC